MALDALEQAIYERRFGNQGGLIHRSDCAVQYVSIRYAERWRDTGIGPSVGSVSDSNDNAVAETTIWFYKTEGIHRP